MPEEFTPKEHQILSESPADSPNLIDEPEASGDQTPGTEHAQPAEGGRDVVDEEIRQQS